MSSQVGNDVMQNMMHQFNNQLQTAQSATFQIANAIYLYFDLEEGDLFKEESANMVVTKLEEIGQNLERYNQLLAEYDHTTTDAIVEALDNETHKIKLQISEALNEISELVSRGSETYKKMVEHIRSDMKKFEPKS